MVKIIKDISEDYNLCKDCEHNESADEEYSAKLICGKHSKVVDVCEKERKNFEECGSKKKKKKGKRTNIAYFGQR